MDSRLLHYTALETFKKEFYKDLLTKEHMQFSQIQIQKLRFPDGDMNEEANFWGYLFVKDGKKYLISSTGDNGEEIDIAKMLPILPKDVEKVANMKGEVHFLVHKPVSVRFKEVMKHTPKQFINALSSLSHTSEKYQKLMWMMSLSQLWDRSYYRISSPAGTGKDSTVDICNSLFGDCGTVESPTIAKLEDRASVLKWLVVNEVVDLGRAEWDYNDIDHYPDAQKKYFDMTTKSAVLDRFPPFRFYGKFTEDFNALGAIDVDTLVENNFEKYKDMLYTYHYFKSNYRKHLHQYDRSKLMKTQGRYATNINKLLNIVDLYSDTQAEFDEWVELINTSLEDYYCMVHTYIPTVKSFCKKNRIILKDTFPEGSKIELQAIAHYCYQEGHKEGTWVDDKFRQIYNFINTLDVRTTTYIDIVSKLRNFSIDEEKERKIVDNKSIWETADEVSKDII